MSATMNSLKRNMIVLICSHESFKHFSFVTIKEKAMKYHFNLLPCSPLQKPFILCQSHRQCVCVAGCVLCPGGARSVPLDVWKRRQGPTGGLAPGGALCDWGEEACRGSVGRSCSFKIHWGPVGSPRQSPTVGPQNIVVVKAFGFRDMRMAVSWRKGLDFYSVLYHEKAVPSLL